MSFLRGLRRGTRNESIQANNSSDLSNFATSFVLNYFQSWGQGLEKRLEMLNKAVALVGIKAKFIQEDEKSGWVGEDIKELERAKKFREELDASFPIGSIEAEVCAVMGIIKKYREGLIEK